MAKKEKKKKLTELEKLKEQLQWYENFADYVKTLHPNLHEDACDFADNPDLPF